MQLPTIHLNGTSKVNLIESLEEASFAIDNAYQALKETAPNGRDYYPQGPQAFTAADQEHVARLRKLDEVKEEIDALTVAIDRIS